MEGTISRFKDEIKFGESSQTKVFPMHATQVTGRAISGGGTVVSLGNCADYVHPPHFAQVLKMLAVMEPNTESPQDPVSEFLVTGRTGRRNAMADILGPHATTSTGDLPERLQTLCTSDPEAGPSTANQGQGGSIGDSSCNVSTATSTTNSAKPADQSQPIVNS